MNAPHFLVHFNNKKNTIKKSCIDIHYRLGITHIISPSPNKTISLYRFP